MGNFLKRNLKGDHVVWMILFLLIGVSILEMFSASSILVSRSSIASPIMRHIMFLGIGLFLVFVVQMIPVRYLRILGYVGVFFSIILLIYTMFFGVKQAGAARFLSFAGIQFQPSELARLSLLLVTADLIDRFQNKHIQDKYFYIF